MSDSRRKILCVHLYDDYSGASKVCSQVIAVFKSAGHEVYVLVGAGGEGGFIRASVRVEEFHYRFSRNRWTLLGRFLLAQWRIFWRVLQLCRRAGIDIVYVSTILPAAAAMAARVRGVPTIVHVHEVELGAHSLFRLLVAIADRCAACVICVSNFTASRLPLRIAPMRVVHNTLSPEEWRLADEIAARRLGCDARQGFTVMMACALKSYKGVDSFIGVAESMVATDPVLRFKLVLNCESEELQAFERGMSLPRNLEIVRRPDSIYDHYENAGLVVNLTVLEVRKETFGLTLLEAMACGVPVIAPPEGGCTELFDEGQGGWFLSSTDKEGLCRRIRLLSRDGEAALIAGRNAKAAAARFRVDRFSAQLRAVVDEVAPGG